MIQCSVSDFPEFLDPPSPGECRSHLRLRGGGALPGQEDHQLQEEEVTLGQSRTSSAGQKCTIFVSRCSFGQLLCSHRAFPDCCNFSHTFCMQHELLPANADKLLRKEWHLYDTLWSSPRRVEDFSLHCSLSGKREEQVRSGRLLPLYF